MMLLPYGREFLIFLQKPCFCQLHKQTYSEVIEKKLEGVTTPMELGAQYPSGLRRWY